MASRSYTPNHLLNGNYFKKCRYEESELYLVPKFQTLVAVSTMYLQT